MSIVADQYRFVVGVDTHAATHTYALVESPSGKELGTETFPTTTAGLSRRPLGSGAAPVATSTGSSYRPKEPAHTER
jgi:hypothetical protein